MKLRLFLPLVVLTALLAVACSATPPLAPDEDGDPCQYPPTTEVIEMMRSSTLTDQWWGWALQAGNRWNNVQAQGHQPWLDGVNARSHHEQRSTTLYTISNPNNLEQLAYARWSGCPFQSTTINMNTAALAGRTQVILMVFTHELGHILGLDHDLFNRDSHARIVPEQCNLVTVMFWSADGLLWCNAYVPPVDFPGQANIDRLTYMYS